MFGKVKETAVHGVVYGLGQTLASVVGFLLIPLYTRHLSTSQYGVIALLSTSSSLISGVLGLGLGAALFRSYYKYETEAERKIVVSTAFYTLLFSALASALLGVAGASTWSMLLFGERGFEKYCMFTFFTVGLTLSQAIPFAVCRARQWSKRYSILNLMFLIVRLGLVIYLVAYRKYGVWGIVLGNFLATLLSTIALTVTISDSIGWSYSLGEARRLLRFGLPAIVGALAGFVITSSDRYFLRAFGGLNQVGVYNLGYRFGRMLQILLAQPLALIWYPMTFSVAREDYATRYYSRMLTYVLLWGAFVWLGISMLSKEIIMLMATPEYWSAYQVVPIVGFSYVLRGLERMLSVGISLAGRTEYLAVAFTIAAAFSLALNTLLIPAYGMMGAAYATILSFALICVLKYFFAKKFYVVPYEWRRLVTVGAVAIGTYMLGSLIHAGSPMTNLALKAVVVLTLPFTLYLFRFYTSDEILRAKALAKSGWAKLRRSPGLDVGA